MPKAVVCREVNKPVSVEDVQLDKPRRGEVMVRLQSWGVGEDFQDSVDWRRGDDLKDGLPDVIGQVIEPIQAEEG